MKVAFSVDGVLADLNGGLSKLAVNLYGTTFGKLSPEQKRIVWRTIGASEDFWEQLNERESGVVAKLAEVAQINRWEVIFLVSRGPTPGSTTQTQTQRWLIRHGFDFPAVWVMQQPSAAAAEPLGLDLIVDAAYVRSTSVDKWLPRVCEVLHGEMSQPVDVPRRAPARFPGWLATLLPFATARTS